MSKSLAGLVRLLKALPPEASQASVFQVQLIWTSSPCFSAGLECKVVVAVVSVVVVGVVGATFLEIVAAML